MAHLSGFALAVLVALGLVHVEASADGDTIVWGT